jgi:hypothetical protein
MKLKYKFADSLINRLSYSKLIYATEYSCYEDLELVFETFWNI